MVSVVVNWIGVHVSNAEDVNEHAEEGSDEEKHHCDVVDVDSNPKDHIINFHCIGINPAKGQPCPNGIFSLACSYVFNNEK